MPIRMDKMKKTRFTLFAMIVALGACLQASAKIEPKPLCPPKYKAPEMDPGLAASALTLTGGVVLLVRAKRNRKQ